MKTLLKQHVRLIFGLLVLVRNFQNGSILEENLVEDQDTASSSMQPYAALVDDK